jgi:hypothetical protein
MAAAPAGLIPPPTARSLGLTLLVSGLIYIVVRSNPAVVGGAMEGIFWFVFGAVAGMAAMPHLQRLAAVARRRLAELDQPRDPTHRP